MTDLQANPPRLPDVVLRDQKKTSSGSDKQDRQVTIAADGAVIPVIYGRQRVGAKIFAVGIYETRLYLGCLWCVGPVEAIESVTVNDKTVSGGTWGVLDYKTDYVGSISQTTDPWLASAISGYADTLVMSVAGQQVPLCYSVVKMRRSDEGFPRIEAIIKGRKVYDPRTATTAYSRNPALCLADWITNPVFGQGLDVDWASVEAVADDCDDTLSDSSARRELDLVIDNDLPVAQWADILRTYAGCLIAHDGTQVKLVSDRPATATRALTESDLIAGSLQLRRLSARDRPTVFEAQFTDNTVTPWRTGTVQAKASGVDAGSVVRRIETVTLPGVTRRAQAYREAVERLNAATLTDLEAEWQTFDEGAADLVGDVVTLTHSVGLTAEPFRISDVRIVGPGRYAVQAQQYSASVYSDSIAPPSGGDYTDLPDPGDIPALDGLAGASGSSYLLKQTDGTILSRIYVTWTAATYPYVRSVDVQFKRQSDSAWETAATTAENDSAFCSPVEDGITYDLRARIVNAVGQVGDWATATHLVVGKTEAPPDCDTFAVSTYGDGTRLFSWTLGSPPVDLAGYQLRYVSGSSGSWASMTALHTGLLVASPYECNALAAGEYTFAVKAIDTSGNESTNAKYITFTLPDPRLAGVLEIVDCYAAGWPGTKTNGWVDSSTGWLMATDTKTWASLATDGKTWATWNDWARDANDLVYTHTALDVGIVTTFTPLVSAVAVEGTVLVEERTSDDNVTWSSYTTAAGAPVTCRYYQAKATVSGAAGTQIGLQSLAITLSADPLEEVIEDLATSSLSGSYDLGTGNVRLPITESFAQIRSVFITLQNVGAGWSWELIDKDTSVGPQIKIYNSSNTLADATIDALIRGL